MSYQGDYAEDYADLNFKFTTRDTDSAPFTLGGTPALSCYKSNDATQSTAGITLTADFDSVTGLNHVKIDLSADAFYATGEDYQVVITTGTVNGNSVVGEVVGTFSIENRFNEVDATKIAGSADAATNLKQTSLCVATGTVQADGSNTATTFKIDSTLGAKGTDYFGNGDGGLVLAFVSSTGNEYQSRRVIAFNTTTDFITVEEAFSATPTTSDAFVLLGRITELT